MTARIRLGRLLAVAGATCAVVVPAAVPSQAATTHSPKVAARSFVSLASQPGDTVGMGDDYLFTPSVGDTVRISGTPSGTVEVTVAGDGSGEGDDRFTFDADIAAPTGSTLSTGAYRHVAITPDAHHAELDIEDGNGGLNCGLTSGSMQVLDIGTDSAGDIDRLNVVFVQSCWPNDGPALLGQISINEPSLAPGVLIAPTALEFPPSYLGAAVIAPVTVVNRGSSPLTVERVKLSGPDADELAVDGCHNQALNPTAGCTATVRFSPNRPDAAAATLKVLDDATPSPQRIPVAGVGLGGVTGVTTAETDPGRSVVTTSYDPATAEIWAEMIPAAHGREEIWVNAVRPDDGGEFEGLFSTGPHGHFAAGRIYLNATSGRGVSVTTSTIPDCPPDAPGWFRLKHIRVGAPDVDNPLGTLRSASLEFAQSCGAGEAVIDGTVAYRAPSGQS